MAAKNEEIPVVTASLGNDGVWDADPSVVSSSRDILTLPSLEKLTAVPATVRIFGGTQKVTVYQDGDNTGYVKLADVAEEVPDDVDDDLD